MISRRITPKRRGRRYLAALAATGLVAGTLLSAGAVLAVHDLDMQLDGDTTNTAWSPPVTPAPGTDWNDLFDASGNATNAIGLTHDFKHGDFTRDFLSRGARSERTT